VYLINAIQYKKFSLVLRAKNLYLILGFHFLPVWELLFYHLRWVYGGFLLVPFMSIVMRLPMFIVAATSSLAIAIHSVTSITNYVRLGIELDFPLLGFLLISTALGAFIGSYLSKFLHEIWLRGILCLILLVIGLRYLSVF